jgi:carbon-monoxide dehydrogenase medium subunit
VVEFRSFATLDAALGALSEFGEDAQVLAGGTDVMVQLQRGDLRPAALVHIEGIAELAEVGVENGSVTLGALVTHRAVIRDARLSTRLPALREACATIGGWQTQEFGTVAGNVCNASPAADTVAPLLVAGAVVELASRRVTRSLPLHDFVLGRRRTARAGDELVTAIRIEAVPPGAGEVYLKVAPRSAMEVALVGLAVRLGLDEGGTVSDVRIAACSVAPVPFRATEAESALLGSRLEPERVAEAGGALRDGADPIDDARATAAYRRRVLAPLLGRALTIAQQRAGGPSPCS